ncbi:MAG TPA: cupin domain-containing protein [Dongiaceae bacterium]|jgi:quercetin dioxygenase-like cupin family protein
MTSLFKTFGRSRIVAAAMIGSIAAFGAVYKATAQEGPEHLVFSTQLPNVPGKSLTAVVVKYGPGEKSPEHHHAGSVFAFVLSGEIRSENSATGPAKIYKAGEAFFEPPGSTHSISENASATEPASLLAIFVADDGATLTSPGQ